MAAAQRKAAGQTDSSDVVRRSRNDPKRLKAFSERLNLMLGEIGLPPRGRARVIKERVGVGGTTAANWLRGDSYPSFEELGRMRRLGLDPVRLLADKGDVPPAKARRQGTSSDGGKRLVKLIESKQILPIEQLHTDDGEWDHTALPNAIWATLLGKASDGLYLHVMKGDAMKEKIAHGTPLLVDTNVTQITEDNGIYALLLEGMVIVRRVQRRLQGGFLICGDNPAVAPEIFERLDSHNETLEQSRLCVLGRAVLAMQKL